MNFLGTESKTDVVPNATVSDGSICSGKECNSYEQNANLFPICEMPLYPIIRPFKSNLYLENMPSNVKYFVQYQDLDYSSDSQSESNDNDVDEKLVPWQHTPYVQHLNKMLVPKISCRFWNELFSNGETGCNLTRRPPGSYIFQGEEMAKKYNLFVYDNPEDNEKVRRRGLGYFHILSDALIARILLILGLEDVKSLLNASAVSRIMYQISGWDTEIWRPICLERRNGDFVFGGSWKICTFYSQKNEDQPPSQLVELWKANALLKETLPDYALEHQSRHEDDGKLENPRKMYKSYSSTENPYESTNKLDKYIVIPGFFSSEMYNDWWLSELKLGGWFHSTMQIPRICAANFSMDEFVKRFMIPNLPCVITDIVSCWPASSKWQPEEFLAQYSETLFKVNEFTVSGQRIRMNFRDFLIYCRENMDSNPLYIFDSSFEKRAPSMLKDYSIPEYFWENFFSVFSPTVGIPYRWWVCGPSHSGTPMHRDPYGTSAWNALIVGHKKWILYPPFISPPGLKKGDHVLKWLKYIYPTLNENDKPIEFIQGPGDMVFIPSRWWHAVLNLDYTVSVTQNMANTYNLKNVVSSLKKKSNLLNFFKCNILPLRPEIYNSI